MSRFAGALALTFALLFPGSPHAQLQVCCAKPALLPDIRATGLEVTQGVQASTLPADGKAYDGVPLVSHRTTVVRLYADVNGNGSANLVSATLTGTRNGKALPGSPLSSDEVFKTLDPGGPKVTPAQRGDSARGFTFTLPDSWTTGIVRLRGRVSAVGVIYGAGGECATAACAVNNAWSVTGVKFLSTGTERVEPVKLISSSWAAVPKPKVALAYPKLLEPLADGAFQFDPARYASSMDITKLGDAAKIGDLVAHCSVAARRGGVRAGARQEHEGVAGALPARRRDARLPDLQADRHAVPLPGPGRGHRQRADRLARPARRDLARQAQQLDALDGGDQRGRAAGRRARARPRDRAQPRERRLRRVREVLAVRPLAARPARRPDSIGLDIRPGSGVAYGGEYRAIAPRTLTGVGSNDIAQPNWSPDEWFDYMSYCPKHRDGDDFTKLDNWLSAKGWRDEFKSLRTYGAAHSRLSAAVTPVPGLHVTGFSVDGGPVVIWNARPAVSVVAPDDKAGYSATVRTKDGKIIGTAVLRTEDTHVDDFDSGAATDVKIVDGIVPLPGATALTLPGGAADVVVDEGGQAGGQAHAQRAQADGQADRADREGADEDGRGAEGRLEGRGRRQGHADGERRLLGRRRAQLPHGLVGAEHGRRDARRAPRSRRSGNGFIRVRVSDGFDTASAVSNVLTVPGRKPDAVITSPAAGATIGASSAIRLAGEAYDDHFAPLVDRNLSWTLDGKTVATGARGALDGVKAGKHTLRLVARRRGGAQGRRRGQAHGRAGDAAAADARRAGTSSRRRRRRSRCGWRRRRRAS